MSEKVTKVVYENGGKSLTEIENLDSVEITTNAKGLPVPKVKCYRNTLDEAVKDSVKAYNDLKNKLDLK